MSNRRTTVKLPASGSMATHTRSQPDRDSESWADMNLCILDLAELTGGRLQLASMPPLEGVLARIERIVLSHQAAGPGDVYWRLAALPGDIEMAFLRGALGIVMTGRAIEPWPGRFSLQIDDSVAALRGLLTGLAASEEQFSLHPPDLKVLQLSGAGSSCIPLPTCGRSASGLTPSRCRRQAA